MASVIPLVKMVSTSLMAGLISHRPIRRGPRHGLDAPLILSLTSYPPRFRTLARSLRCLLNQSVSPDRLILWVAEADHAFLPSNVHKLERQGLEIRTCPDWRSLKKIAPTLMAFPDAYIATAGGSQFDVHDAHPSLEKRQATKDCLSIIDGIMIRNGSAP